jgi:hypothetical protein
VGYPKHTKKSARGQDRDMMNSDKVLANIHRNTTTSYGLTLVVGLPFPPEFAARIGQLQHGLEALAPGRFIWYTQGQLHATLLAPLRGRYRAGPPLRRAELPADLPGLIADFGDILAETAPFALRFAGVEITEDGSLILKEDTMVQRLVSRLRWYPELDPPKYGRGLHIAIGFVNKYPFLTHRDEEQQFKAGFAQMTDTPIGALTIQHVWLVHYANRTLSTIVGKTQFTLGQASPITTEQLLSDLGIR